MYWCKSWNSITVKRGVKNRLLYLTAPILHTSSRVVSIATKKKKNKATHKIKAHFGCFKYYLQFHKNLTKLLVHPRTNIAQVFKCFLSPFAIDPSVALQWGHKACRLSTTAMIKCPAISIQLPLLSQFSCLVTQLKFNVLCNRCSPSKKKKILI